MPDRCFPVSAAPVQGSPSPSCTYCAADYDPADGDWPPGRLAHLYLGRGLSTYRMSQLTGFGRQRLTRVLHQAGVSLRARGAARLRPLRRRDRPDLAQLLARLYLDAGLSSRQIAAPLGLPERTVRDRLRRYGVPARTRGRWNREDRHAIPAVTLGSLYEQLGPFRRRWRTRGQVTATLKEEMRHDDIGCGGTGITRAAGAAGGDG